MEKSRNNHDKGSEYREGILEEEGLGTDMGEIFPGEEVLLGDGLGRKDPEEEDMEDKEGYTNEKRVHSKMCPINLGYAIDETKLNQPHDDPTEDEFD